jgi:DNA-binding transcriptional LysR family regulator
VRLLSGLEAAAASVNSGKNVVRGRLRINLDPFFSQLIPGPQLNRFIKQFPELKVELITRDRLGDLVADGFDLAIRFGEPRATTLYCPEAPGDQGLNGLETGIVQGTAG